MSPNMLMFVRTAVDKIETTLKEFEKRKQLEAAAEERKKTSAPAPAIFTDKEISVKPLKGEGAKVCHSCYTEKPMVITMETRKAAGPLSLEKAHTHPCYFA